MNFCPCWKQTSPCAFRFRKHFTTCSEIHKLWGYLRRLDCTRARASGPRQHEELQNESYLPLEQMRTSQSFYIGYILTMAIARDFCNGQSNCFSGRCEYFRATMTRTHGIVKRKTFGKRLFC